MKPAELQTEISRLSQLLSKPQFLSSENIRSLRKRKARLIKEAKAMLEKNKIAALKYGKQLQFI